MMTDKDLTDDVLDVIIAGAKTSMEQYLALSLKAERAANRQQNQQQNIPENIPATQFKPVADLYGLTSPTGGETSFTFDAVEARDFIDGGWSVQEYVELERYQEAMLQGAEPVTTAYKLPFEQWLSQQTGTIDVECGCVMTEVFFHWLRVAYEAANSSVIPDGWVACSERMPDDDDFVYIWPRPDFGVELHVGQYCECHPKGDGWYAQVYEQNYGIEWCPITVTHWMPLPAAPQQEVTQALAKGMERYGDAMQKLADSGD